jgi:hypothetical protein
VREINATGSDLFYWSFYLVVVFLLLNLVTKIVFDSHAEVKDSFVEKEKKMKKE